VSLFSRIPSALFVVAVPLFLVTAGVTWAFNSPGVYDWGFQRYDVSRITGITDADLRQVSADIRSYFNSRQAPLAVRTRSFGVERELFNPKEITHMRDVKRLVWGVYTVAAVTAFYLLAAMGLGLVFQRRRFARILARRLLLGGALTIVLIVGVGLFALVGFDTLFLKFHQLSFANDLWQLDSRTDFLVMLFPQDFWLDATMWVATRALAAALAIGAVAGGYLLYMRRRANKMSGETLGRLEEAQEV
jgi:integral membrane protein (TIGR01906 family)